MREIRIRLYFSYLLLILNIFAHIPRVSAQEYCYSSGGVFGVIVLSVFTTLFVIALTVAIVWLLWTKNHLNLDFILKTINRRKGEKEEKTIDLESSKHSYAFDNPYFEDEEKEEKKDSHKQQKDTIILVEGTEEHRQQTLVEMNNKNNSQRISDGKQTNGQIINNRFVKSLPLSAVFSNVPFKKSKPENVKSMDDYFYQEKPERLEAELIGRDFTGLGFNICGNMKDGIFIKNVLNRGPANESGKIKSGDRIIGVNVSFEGMVFDDAVSILSYASPYNVRIEVEKCGQHSTIDKLTTTLNANKNLSSKTTASLVHPLYRSHSLNDLTTIAKDLSLSEKSTSSSGKNVIQKIKTEIMNRIHLKSDKSSPIEESTHFERQKTPEIETQIKTIETLEQKQEIGPKVEDVVDRSQIQTELQIETEIPVETEVKKVVPAKRKGKAPQPPSEPLSPNINFETHPISISPTNGETIETKAQVHNEDNEILKTEEIDIEIIDNKNDDQLKSDELSGHMTSSTESMDSKNERQSEDSYSVPIRANSPQRVQSPTGKTKSSSMSDLTSNKSDKSQTILLERAVSLDMNDQKLPEESHLSHGKNLLVLNDNNTDSMPIISWSLTKSMKNDINSSESTLNEINQSFINSIDSSEKIDSDLNLYDLSKDMIKIDTSLTEPEDYISHIEIEVPPITSTPMKTQDMSANQPIDQYIQLDSSLSSSGIESPDQTIIEERGADSQTDSESKQTEKSETSYSPSKEVIELSKSELDGVMMSHKEFLQKQANSQVRPMKGMSPIVTSVISTAAKTLPYEPQYESLDFESWHYMSEDENSNLNKTPNEETLYKTALDISLDKETDDSVKTRRLPEVSGITLKTGDNRQITNTVFISTSDLPDSSLSSSSSSPPSK